MAECYECGKTIPFPGICKYCSRFGDEPDNWRPDDWKNSWDKEREFPGMLSKAEIFEAGADAGYKYATRKVLEGEKL